MNNTDDSNPIADTYTTRLLKELEGGSSPLPMAIVAPETTEVLQSAKKAYQEGIITPLLVGNERVIHSLIRAIEWEVPSKFIVNAPTPAEALERSLQCVREEVAHALMKGDLSTDVFMRAVLNKETGVRTSGRMSHVFLMDIPALKRPLIITDGAVNVAPDTEALVAIAQNAIGVAHMLGNERPKVAVLSAHEKASSSMPSSVQAELVAEKLASEMADVVGPISFDLAVSAESASLKGYENAVAGSADVLVVPNIETGNSLVKSLVYFADATAAGVVVGGTIPLALTSRGDSVASRVASMALASIVSSRSMNSRTASI